MIRGATSRCRTAPRQGTERGGDPQPSADALTAWNDEAERRVAELVERAAG